MLLFSKDASWKKREMINLQLEMEKIGKQIQRFNLLNT